MISMEPEPGYPAAATRCWIVEVSEPVWLKRLWQAMSVLCAWAAAASCALTANAASPALERASLISCASSPGYDQLVVKMQLPGGFWDRSEERRVGKEC